jgi:hypothetical protein
MNYQVELSREVGLLRWKWSVILPSGYMVSDWSMSKIGALYSITRSIKIHKKTMQLKEQTETWEIV